MLHTSLLLLLFLWCLLLFLWCYAHTYGRCCTFSGYQECTVLMVITQEKGNSNKLCPFKGKSERCVIKFLLLPLESKLDYLSNTLLYLDISFRASDLHLHVASKFSVPDGFYMCRMLVILFSCYPYNCSCPTPISFTDDWWVIHSLAITSKKLCLPSHHPMHTMITFKALVIIPSIHFSVLHQYMRKL